MTLAYVPPGVTVQELTSPTLNPLLAIPGSICLVGLANGSITRTDTIQLSGTTPVVLPGVPVNSTMTSSSIVSIVDAVNSAVAPSGFSSTTDYTFTPGTYTLVRQITSNTLAGTATAGATSITLSAGAVPAAGQVVRLTHSTTTETAVVASVAGQVVTLATPLVNGYSSADTVTWGNIPDGDTVYVTYTYTPADYFFPIRLTSIDDIQTRFGNIWDATGNVINSPLSFAASLAFQNGASNVVLQPLYVVTSGVRVQPTAIQNANPTTWSTVYNNLLDFQDINLVVPVIGQSQANVTDAVVLQVLQTTQDFIYEMKHGQNQYMVGILGEDSSAATTVAQEAVLIAHANTLQSRYGNDVTQQLVMLNTSQFSSANRTGTLLIGGQYAAAGIAGMLAARTPASTLTRQVVSGIQQVTDSRTGTQKNTDAANGLLVLENKGNLVQVRHGITMDLTTVVTRELNVVRGKHYVIQTIQQTLDEQVIGKLVADANATTTLNNLVIATLEDLRRFGDIISYSGVESQITSFDPTAMAVRFAYQPPFVVNYVTVTFNLDLTAQTVTVNSASSANV